MIAIKARARRVSGTVLGPNGTPLVLETVRPEGLEARPEAMPLEAPREDRATLWLVDDDAVPEGDARRARPGDVPLRDDLPASHPLRGKRVLRCVPAGWPDATIDAKGRLVPVDAKTGEALESRGPV